jgi:ABC-type bacteriocin/lantibiotic exporter with double-glycine peptidase domain
MHQSKSKPPPEAGAAPAASPEVPAHSSRSMTRLVLELIRPYRGWLIIVFVAMLIETVMSIAAPWPLKIILDNVVGKHKLPEFWGGCEIFRPASRRWR